MSNTDNTVLQGELSAVNAADLSHAADHGNNHSPLAQFEIKKIFEIDFLGFDLSITNSALYMIIPTIIAMILMLLATNKRSLIPSKKQLIVENFYKMIQDMAKGNIGDSYRPFLPFIITLFLFILSCNIAGLTPYSFTSTSQIATTFTLSIGSFLIILIYGIIHNGPIGFFKMFIPSGAPMWIVPLIFIIELLSFFIRPFTLALRLLANMVAGHILMKIIAGFIIALGVLFGSLPFIFAVVITGFEFLVAFLQAYIFSILVCIYLGEMAAKH